MPRNVTAPVILGDCHSRWIVSHSHSWLAAVEGLNGPAHAVVDRLVKSELLLLVDRIRDVVAESETTAYVPDLPRGPREVRLES